MLTYSLVVRYIEMTSTCNVIIKQQANVLNHCLLHYIKQMFFKMLGYQAGTMPHSIYFTRLLLYIYQILLFEAFNLQ